MSDKPTHQTTISREEIARIERARCISARAALREAVEILDGMKAQIEKSNPGRKRGTVSQVGQFAADAIQRAADAIWEKRDGIGVP